jgi:hypothetical protein
MPLRICVIPFSTYSDIADVPSRFLETRAVCDELDSTPHTASVVSFGDGPCNVHESTEEDVKRFKARQFALLAYPRARSLNDSRFN